MATENTNQSGASAVADSAKEDATPLNESAGPDSAAAEPQAASDANPTAQENSTPATSEKASADASADSANDPEASGGDFSALLENYEREQAASKQEGEIVRGMVVGVSDKYVMVDIGYKSEGVVAREEFVDRNGDLTVKAGDEVDVLIKSLENQEGYAILSRAAAVQVQSWEKLRL